MLYRSLPGHDWTDFVSRTPEFASVVAKQSPSLGQGRALTVDRLARPPPWRDRHGAWPPLGECGGAERPPLRCQTPSRHGGAGSTTWSTSTYSLLRTPPHQALRRKRRPWRSLRCPGKADQKTDKPRACPEFPGWTPSLGPCVCTGRGTSSSFGAVPRGRMGRKRQV